MTPLEVVIRDPKLSGHDFAVKLVVAAAVLATKAFIVMFVVPPVASVFGVEAHPNYGEAVLLVLLANFLVKGRAILTLSPSDTNRYLTGGK